MCQSYDSQPHFVLVRLQVDDTHPAVTYKSMARPLFDNFVGGVQSTVSSGKIFLSNGTTGCQLAQLSRCGREVTMKGAEGGRGPTVF